MKKVINKIKNVLSPFLSDKQYMFLDYFSSRKFFPKLSNPKTFSEKMQWIKLFANLERYSSYVDKYEVRNYVKKKIGKKYLIPLLGSWKRFEDIPFDKLPNRFVLKASHGSGYNFVCKDKSSLNKNVLKKIVNLWLNEDYYKKTREIQYKLCVPRIICEKYLEDESGGLRDYKFFCFGGKPKIVQIDSDRFSEHKRDLMDMNWKKLPVRYIYPNLKRIIKKPKKFAEMKKICIKLSKNFNFIRVDMYCVGSKVYFGELTFTPENGLGEFFPGSFDYKIGKLIKLENYEKESKKS